jgi:hypothetical protein
MGKRKSTNQTSTSSSSSSTPTNPDWVSHTAQSLNTGIQSLGGRDPYSLVAPVSDLETQAANSAAKLGGGFGSGGQSVGGDQWFADLLSQPAPAVGSASLLDNLDAYQNPYRDQVVDAALADYDYSAGATRASQDLELTGSNAFNGSGSALTRSMTERQLNQGRGTLSANLLKDMFTTSAGLASQDAERRQQASLANAQMALQDRQMRGQLALDREGSMRSNVASQAALGAQLRAADQAMRSAPTTQLGTQIDMFSGLPLQLFQGQSSTSTGTSDTRSSQTPSLLDMLGQIAQTASTVAKIGR